MIKKLSLIVCFTLSVVAVRAQHPVISFFDELGSAKIQTEEYSQAHDTIVQVEHRLDDIIWSRYVYRIIDMRYKQNYQLHFPNTADDTDYKNLYLLIAGAVIDGLPIYEKTNGTIKPDFKRQEPISKKDIPYAFFIYDPQVDHSDDPTFYQPCCSEAMLIHYDSVANMLELNSFAFDKQVRNQLKYLVQEITFFDKHTSRMYHKIIAIAPLHAERISSTTDVSAALIESIMFWIPYDQLRPYLAMQYVIPNRNETKRVTFDEFFQKHLYTSYIVGEGNMYNRWIPNYTKTAQEAKKEQERIASELLNFEQDLWEY